MSARTRKCPACYGTGGKDGKTSWLDDYPPCPKCEGTGRIAVQRRADAKPRSPQRMVGFPWVSVAATITIDEALRVIFAETIHNANFDADRWSAGTAKDLIAAGEMINRELQARRKPNEEMP